jgi:spermidine synthase
MDTLDRALPSRATSQPAPALAERLIPVLFFFSGCPALIYQLMWQRALFRIFGVNIESVTIVVTAFMVGLGLGALAGGRLAKLRSVPLLLLLAIIEALIGGFAVISLGLFEWIGDAVIRLPLTATAAVAFGLLLIPTLLMGATLPVLVGYLARKWHNVGRSVSVLYAVNTLGAGVACIAGALLIFPLLGMHHAVLLAAALNWLVAAGALMGLWRGGRDTAPPITEPSRQDGASGEQIGFQLAATLVFLSGFISLSYEIFLFRVMSYMTGNVAPALALTLGWFLIGIASGSNHSRLQCRRSGGHLAALASCVLAANVLGFMLLPALNMAASIGPAMILLALLFTLLIAHFWGVVMPLVAHLAVRADDNAGTRLSYLYLANIIGSAAGGFLTGFVLMDVLDMRGIQMFLVLCGLAFSSVLVFLSRRRAPVVSLAGIAAAALMAGLAQGPLTSQVYERLMWKDHATTGPTFLRVIENRSGVVTLDTDKRVYGGGVYDGQVKIDLADDTNGMVRPLALSLYHASPRDVLSIGLSGGAWAQVLASDPTVERLTVAEINPGYLQLVRDEPLVASVLNNPKVHLVIDDGRRWLNRNPDAKFDAIVANISHNFRANATNVLSVEFLEVVRRHLKPGGTFFYNTTDSERVQRTGCVVFPYGYRVFNHMLVSDAPIELDARRWRRILFSERIDGRPLLDASDPRDLAVWDHLAALLKGTDKPLPQQAFEDCPSILARTQSAALVTDDNMGTEWGYSWSH